MRTLYPEIEPFDHGRLRVDDRHELYYEQCGNPDGLPVVILHGGPGGGCNADMRRFHNPERYRIVLFDQRGCGRSTPHADLSNNTTWHLVEDIETLRRHLGIERWQVFGGSWGSTLALAYAERHPEQVLHLVLRGIFLVRRWELEWFYQEGACHLFPDTWEGFRDAIPADERSDMIAAYHRRLNGCDPAARLAAAKAWSAWEGSTSRLEMDPQAIAGHEEDMFALAFASIENHYFFNAGFFEEDGQLLRDAHRLAGIPGVIVHGRYDMICPLANAWDLHHAWPGSRLHISPLAGHAASEVQNVDALVRATDEFAG
ncbi:prolyl aminopeptidase [Kerstersia gyiorum]|jgi:proline iminopeptidase|uniref:prolyl aminopeptidase n=1 Tax=Kerstersia gyiorum TaxID=206506 RepID=UPI000FDA56A2|nr:prolyl aminopeptidase [Kerstersia gyiorum]AZV94338.1 prolyl aminopeptidase [Bordetella sp. J329]MCH4272855.1 prolyl aminopeptidase [Kerstersia gyiorum]MCI1229114.1 prolyl aminopeptidase [Kerstersia gyiorum]MCP1633723.1 proline iminopeptidase [Kerstersia gyiorum]MCP1637441.1 proline iminopeptidase [Kerstersia gyiorum]